MPDSATDPLVSSSRAEIDDLDRAILAALNRRVEVVRLLHDHKAANGYPMLDEGREQRMVDALRAVNGGPLDDAGVAALVRAVIELTGREVRRLRDDVSPRPAP